MTNEHSTYLNSLIFDQDKNEVMHTLGCRYLFDTNNALRLIKKVYSKDVVQIKLKALSHPIRPVIDKEFVFQRSNKAIGFLDLIISFAGESHTRDNLILVEVKAKPVPIFEIIQQLSTYLLHYSTARAVLATMYPMGAREIELLNDHDIEHIWIDPNYAQSYLSAKKTPIAETKAF